jgi:taurine transport system ATP-binding protein
MSHTNAIQSIADIPIRQEAPLIEIKNLQLQYRTLQSHVVALDNINLELELNDFVCVLGPSGCGKTSLLRIIAGYEKPTAGEVIVAGKKLIKPNAEVGVVFQHPNLFPWLSIQHNVEFGLKMKNLPKPARKATANALIEQVGLTSYAHMLPHQLSGGMKQRAALARSLAIDPKIILMDEPFGALDAITREGLQGNLKSLWQQSGKTIFFITHDVDESLLLATRIIVMSGSPGRVIIDMPNPLAEKNTDHTNMRKFKEYAEIREYLISALKQG